MNPPSRKQPKTAAGGDPAGWPAPQISRWEPAIVLLFALAVRGGMLLGSGGSLADDPDGYRRLAENLWEHGTLGYGTRPTAYRPPLYPLALAPCVALESAAGVATALLHVLLGVATVWVVYRLGYLWGLGRFTILAAVLVACDPVLLQQSGLVMTETPAALLAAAALWTWTLAARRPSARRAALAGGLIALAALCRPVFLVWGILIAAAFPWLFRRFSGRWRVWGAFAAAGLLVLLPWAVRNQIHFGRPIVATTHGGYTLLLANNPSFYDYVRHGRWGSVWDAEAFHTDWGRRLVEGGPQAELQNDRRAYAAAWQAIRHDPWGFLRACPVRAGRLWQLVPHRVGAGEGPRRCLARYLVGCWYLFQFSLAAVGAVILLASGSGEAPSSSGAGLAAAAVVGMGALLLVISCTMVHTVYWSNMRMRAPLVPAIALAAASGAAGILNRTLKRKS